MQTKQISQLKLVLMITTTVFSFTSMSEAFFLKGYSAIPWFIISALAYFIPYCFIMSDLTSVYQDKAGGVYSWLKETTSKRIAFIAVFLWYSSYFIWMISLYMKTWIPLSIILFGKDYINQVTVFGMPTVWIIGLLSIIMIMIISTVSLGGFQKVAKISVFSGKCMLVLMGTMVVGSLICLVMNGGHFQEGFAPQEFFTSRGSYQTPMENLSFFIFGITAFGGLDTVASMVNNTGKQRKKFGRLIMISAVSIIVMYMVGMFMWGASINLDQFAHSEQFHLGNIMYGLMGQLSLNVCHLLHVDPEMTKLVYQIFIRLTALTLYTAYLGLLSVNSFTPLRSLIEGMRDNQFKFKAMQVDEQGISHKAVLYQGIALSIFVLLISLSQHYVANLYNQLTLMTNISRSIPYLLVALAYPAFRKLYHQEELHSMIRTKRGVYTCSILVVVSVALSIFFTVYEKVTAAEYQNAFLLVIGPIVFALFAYVLFNLARKSQKFTL